MTKETMQAYTEIDCILSNMPNEYVSKVPNKLREKFKNEKDSEYVFKLDENKRINEHSLNKKTRALLAMLKYNYWCKNQEEKEKLVSMFNENQRKHEEYIREKYNPDNIFKYKGEFHTESNDNLLEVIKKETLFTKVINFIKRIFRG